MQYLLVMTRTYLGIDVDNNGTRNESVNSQRREQPGWHHTRASEFSEPRGTHDGRYGAVNNQIREQFSGYNTQVNMFPDLVPATDRYEDNHGRNDRTRIIRSPVYSNRHVDDTHDNTRHIYASLPRSEPRMPTVSSPRYSKSTVFRNNNRYDSPSQKRDGASDEVLGGTGTKHLQVRETASEISHRSEAVTIEAASLSDDDCVMIGEDHNERLLAAQTCSEDICSQVVTAVTEEAEEIECINKQSDRNNDCSLEPSQCSGIECSTDSNVDGLPSSAEPNGNCSPLAEDIEIITGLSKSISTANDDAKKVLDLDPVSEGSSGRVPETGSATLSRKTAINPLHKPNSRAGGTKLIDVIDVNTKSSSPLRPETRRRGRPRQCRNK